MQTQDNLNEQKNSQEQEKLHEQTNSAAFSALVASFVEKLKTPAQDVEKNVKALLAESISKMDLVTKEELQRQQQLLASATAKLAMLEEKLAALESQAKGD